MAGLFAHVWIASLVLKRLSKKNFISRYENIDDYFFGAIAPDIRYVVNTPRDLTHKPIGENSIFEALRISSVSMPFMAGYETHLVVDDTWSNENKSMEKSVYEYYGIDVNNSIQKYSLYLLVDDYFQGEADWLFPIISAGNIFRATDFFLLKELGFTDADIIRFKSLVAAYLREPGIDTFNVFNFEGFNFDENLFSKTTNMISSLSHFLKDFKKVSIEKCIESLEKYV